MLSDRILGKAVAPRAEAGDGELVILMARGDRDAHRKLYEQHAGRILTYLIGRLCGDRGLAEEILHDVMLEAWRAAHTFRGESGTRAWLLGIAHHKACNALRARQRESLEPDPIDASAATIDIDSGRGSAAVDEWIDLDRALAALPDEQRAALELLFLHGLSVDEAAAVLCVASGTIKSRIFRAKRAMRRILAREANDGL